MIDEFLAMRYLSQWQYKTTLREFLTSTHDDELKYNSYKRSCWTQLRELNHITSKSIIYIVLMTAIAPKADIYLFDGNSTIEMSN